MNQLTSIVEDFSNRRLLVIGDLIADCFVYGEISRVSREAPVLILRHERTETVPGGAANCAHNLARLGANVTLVGVVGADEAGAKLIEKLKEANIETRFILQAENFVTTTKMRVLAGGAHSLKQQVIRVDYENEKRANHVAELSEMTREALKEMPQACIVSDYDYGVASSEIRDLIRQASQQKNFPATVDSRFRLRDFHGFTSATPNEAEVEELCGQRFASVEELIEQGEALRCSLKLESLLITRGKDGMLLLEEKREPFALAVIGAHEAVDVTGAGDTVIAAYSLALAANADARCAATIANYAGGIVVMKRGTATLTQAELIASIKSN